jgi:DNA-binding beta-propeller fold protein YncE
LSALTGLKPTTPALTHVASEAGKKGGVTSVGGRLYVLSQTGQITEYDVANFTHKQLPVSGLGSNCLGLASCAKNNCLYVSDHNTHKISRITLSDSFSMINWSTARGPIGMSVNVSTNILVACYSSTNLIQEYTTNGSLVREIRVQSVANPLHAIQIADGKLAISCGQWGGGYIVSVISDSGMALCSSKQYGGTSCLAVDKDGSIIIGDWTSKRVLALNSSLNTERDLNLSADSQLQEPYSFCIDGQRDRLFVCEFSGGRVLVFDNVTIAGSDYNQP